MPSTSPSHARKCAERVSRYLSSEQLRVKFRSAARQEEQKVMAEPIGKYLEGFLKDQHLAPGSAWYDFEGNDHREPGHKLSYEIFGTNAWPDAAVLGSFKCAFEFDREPDQGRAHFKEQLMKASVHVLSSAYEACLFAYVLRPGSTRSDYLSPRCVYSTRLDEKLRDAGLYVCLIPKRAA